MLLFNLSRKFTLLVQMQMRGTVRTSKVCKWSFRSYEPVLAPWEMLTPSYDLAAQRALPYELYRSVLLFADPMIRVQVMLQ